MRLTNVLLFSNNGIVTEFVRRSVLFHHRSPRMRPRSAAKIGMKPTLPRDMRWFVVARTEIFPVPRELMLKLPVS